MNYRVKNRPAADGANWTVLSPWGTSIRRETTEAEARAEADRLNASNDEPYDLVGAIIEYETEGLSSEDTLELFAHLIRTGQAWTLQGHYGRTAQALINMGHISEDGEVL